MPDDPMEQLRRLGEQDRHSQVGARIERERRLQTRSRRIRWLNRWIVLVCGGGGLLLFYFAEQSGYMKLAGFGLSLLCPAMIAALILVAMGGMVPIRMRSKLSARERRILDD